MRHQRLDGLSWLKTTRNGLEEKKGRGGGPQQQQQQQQQPQPQRQRQRQRQHDNDNDNHNNNNNNNQWERFLMLQHTRWIDATNQIEQLNHLAQEIKLQETRCRLNMLGGGFKYFSFHPYLGKWSNLQMGWFNHQVAYHCHHCDTFLPDGKKFDDWPFCTFFETFTLRKWGVELGSGGGTIGSYCFASHGLEVKTLGAVRFVAFPSWHLVEGTKISVASYELKEEGGDGKNSNRPHMSEVSRSI